MGRRDRIAPCEERRKLHLEKLEQIRRERGDDAYYLALGKIGLTDYWFYLKEILYYDWMDPWLHGEEIIRFIENTIGKTRLVLVPRGGGKTAVVTVPMPGWWLAQDALNLVGVSNAKEDRAKKMTRAAAMVVEQNARYQLCYPWVKPSRKWGSDGYFLDRGELARGNVTVGERVDANIKSFGIRGNVTGSHFTKFISDDLINREMVKFPAQMRVAEDFFNESLNCVDSGGDYIVCATRWTYQDLYGKLMTGELMGNQGKVEVLKLGISYWEDGEEKLIWPTTRYFDRAVKKEKMVGYSWDYIQSRQRNLGSLFNALYYNEPVTDADRAFDTALVKTYKILPFETGPVAMVGIESESQSGALCEAVVKMAKSEGRKFRLEAIHSRRVSKKERILSVLQPLIAGAKFNMPEHLWRGDDSLGEEIRTYDKGHDDCIDACAYCADLAREGMQENPLVYIMVDPAFTTQSYSDYTAIVAGCYQGGDFWVLDCVRFKTDRTDYICRMIFRMYDKFKNGVAFTQSRASKGLKGVGMKADKRFRVESSEKKFEVDVGDLFYRSN